MFFQKYRQLHENQEKDMMFSLYDVILFYNKLIMRKKGFSLWDDVVARVALNNNTDLAKDLINAALEADGSSVKIVEVGTQKSLNDLQAKGVVMDALAKDEDGNVYQIEIQNEPRKGFDVRLALGASYLMQMSLRRGDKHEEIRSHTVIAFCNYNPVEEADFPVYHIRRTVDETGRTFEDGGLIVLVNGKYRHDSASLLGKVIHDMSQTESKEMILPSFQKTAEFLMGEEGVKAVGIHSEELIKQGRMENAVQMIRSMLKEGMDLELIKKILRPDHDEDEIQEILQKAMSAA